MELKDFGKRHSSMLSSAALGSSLLAFAYFEKPAAPGIQAEAASVLANIGTRSLFVSELPDTAFGSELAVLAERSLPEIAEILFGKPAPVISCKIIPKAEEDVKAVAFAKFYIQAGKVLDATMLVNPVKQNNTEDAIRHELGHLVIAAELGRAPRWIDEGLAARVESQQQLKVLESMVSKAHFQGTLFPVRELIKVDEYPPNTALFYAQSYCFVDYLIFLQGRDSFISFAKDVIKSDDPAAEFAMHYRMSMHEIEAQWRASLSP